MTIFPPPPTKGHKPTFPSRVVGVATAAAAGLGVTGFVLGAQLDGTEAVLLNVGVAETAAAVALLWGLKRLNAVRKSSTQDFGPRSVKSDDYTPAPTINREDTTTDEVMNISSFTHPTSETALYGTVADMVATLDRLAAGRDEAILRELDVIQDANAVITKTTTVLKEYADVVERTTEAMK